LIQGVESHADMFQYVGRSAGDPFSDRQRRCPRPHHADGQGKDAHESVAHSITWIGHLSEAAQQPGHFLWRDLCMLAELVKYRQDQR
jgi:hypothetical protein